MVGFWRQLSRLSPGAPMGVPGVSKKPTQVVHSFPAPAIVVLLAKRAFSLVLWSFCVFPGGIRNMIAYESRRLLCAEHQVQGRPIMCLKKSAVGTSIGRARAGRAGAGGIRRRARNEAYFGVQSYSAIPMLALQGPAGAWGKMANGLEKGPDRAGRTRRTK